MKKFFILTLVIVSSFILFSCVPNEETIIEETIIEEQTLVVASIMMDGNFMDGFATKTYSYYKADQFDQWARQLIFGYETYSIDKYGKIILNETVVKDLATEINQVTGDKTYTFELNQDLYWSDGEKITAKDYVFSLLMQASIDWKNSGASLTIGDKLTGYTEYRSGSSSENVRFEGVKLIDEYIFSLTLDSEFTPFFYETQHLVLKPLPFHRLVPNEKSIYSDSQGAWIESGGFELLDQASSISGYRYVPDVTSGPYKLVSYINQEAVLKINPLFKGNFEGKIPTIENIIIKNVSEFSNVDMVIDGQIDLVTDIMDSYTIRELDESITVSTNSHSRNGYGFLAMAAHFGPTDDYRVRQAIAHVIRKQFFYDYYLDGLINMTYSEYGRGQWMTIESEQWIKDNINVYQPDPRIANDILDTTEWIYEADGVTPFDELKANDYSEYFRHNALGETLEINHLVMYSCSVQTDVFNYLNNAFQSIGINYSLTQSEQQLIFDHYYYSYELAPEDKKYHLFNSAVTFDLAYDPYINWHSDSIGTYYNPNLLEDSVANPNAPLEDGEKTLDELTESMRVVEPGDYDTYLTLWRAYQLRWNKLTPNIPTYSNQYYNVFDSKLKGLGTSTFWDWTYSIYDMYFEETIEE